METPEETRRPTQERRRELLGRPPHPHPRPRTLWTCPICSSPHRRSTHHIEPQRIRGNHERTNKEDICRPCHDLVERIYEQVIAETFPALYQSCRAVRLIERNMAYLRYELEGGRENVPPERWSQTGVDPDADLAVVIRMLDRARSATRAANKALDRASMVLDWHSLYAQAKTIIATGTLVLAPNPAHEGDPHDHHQEDAGRAPADAGEPALRAEGPPRQL